MIWIWKMNVKSYLTQKTFLVLIVETLVMSEMLSSVKYAGQS